MNVAVIDLGTNTCNLLIAEVVKTGFNILHQSKLLVQLGDDKIRNNQISPAATKRAVDALLQQQKTIEQFKAEKVKVVVTSAVRSAENKIEFLEKISSCSGWVTRVVSGEREAGLIFKGVLLALQGLKNPAVILDIGGGSNELIVAHAREILWKESQPTGMARVINRFALSDPLKPDELQILQNFFSEQHHEAFLQCKKRNVGTLIGCSGSFDTIADIIDRINPGEKQRRRNEIALPEFFRVYKHLVGSTREQRLKIKGMDNVRVDLIVPAMIFIAQLISETGISNIIQTDFALREGVLAEMMEA